MAVVGAADNEFFSILQAHLKDFEGLSKLEVRQLYQVSHPAAARLLDSPV